MKTEPFNDREDKGTSSNKHNDANCIKTDNINDGNRKAHSLAVIVWGEPLCKISSANKIVFLDMETFFAYAGLKKSRSESL